MNSRVNSSWRKDVYTAREAAPILHVSVATVYRMIRAGVLQPSDTLHRTGHRGYVIPREEIEHYISSLKQSARRLTNAS
jgi:excisionase family DNA binding protein